MKRSMQGFSLAWRFLLWFVVVALLPLALFGYLSLQQSEASLRRETLGRMSRLADKKTLQIKIYLAERTHDAELLARGKLVEEALPVLSRSYQLQGADSAAYRAATKPLVKYFAALIGPGEDMLFHDVFLITLQGEIIYTYKHEADFATNLIDGPYRDTELAKVFREARMTLGSSISDFEDYSPSAGPAAFISTPIFREGRLLGVMAFQLDTQRIYQVAGDNIGLGVSGETVLGKMTGAGEAVFVAPLRRDQQAALRRKIDLLATALPMRKALTGQRGSGMGVDYAGNEVVAAWRYLPELRWGMVVKMDVDEAFAPLYRQRRNTLQAWLALALLGGFAAFYFGWQMVMRLRNLAQSAEEIARGDLNRRVKESGTDEISDLAGSFNHMTESLQALNLTLEKRIEERTRELHEVNRLLQEEIVEREKRAQELQKFQDIIDSSDDAIISKSPEGIIQSWNNGAERIFGYAAEEVIGKPMTILIPPDRLNEEPAILARISTGERVEHFETVRRRKDGQLINISATLSPILDHQGRVIGISKIARDITYRKKAEEQLRTAAAAFETHEAILITDANANIIRVNQAFQDITGYYAEEVLGKNPRILKSGRQGMAFYEEMWRRLLKTGAWSGEIWDKRKGGKVYPKWLTISAVKNEQGETTEYVAIFRDITEIKKAEEEIRNLAFYDVLTGLSNRRLLLDRFRLALSVSARTHHCGAVLFLDMDRFKSLNDTLGHDYGDLLLIEVAKRLQSCVREMDTVARMGGDEFVVLIEEVSVNAQEASQKVALIADKIRTSLAEPYHLKRQECFSSPSIGVCLYCGNNESVESVLKHADLAMYQAKEAGRNAVRFFDPDMQLSVETHAMMEADLRRAIPGKQLRLHYQIQVDSDHRPLGVEALVRWMHPARGMILPIQFIPIAEESSLILDVGHWVLETACRQLAAWGKNEHMCRLELAVNVSAQQFRRRDFVGTISAALREHQIDPACLKLELTENVVLADLADIAAKMHELKALGIKLSLDDFGTGYSSLSYLKRLPFDQIKIDQSFVLDIATDPNDAVMVQTIINLAQNFRVHVIAEGVETETQLDFLRQSGCMAYQGYLFSKPVPIEEFEALLVKR